MGHFLPPNLLPIFLPSYWLVFPPHSNPSPWGKYRLHSLIHLMFLPPRHLLNLFIGLSSFPLSSSSCSLLCLSKYLNTVCVAMWGCSALSTSPFMLCCSFFLSSLSFLSSPYFGFAHGPPPLQHSNPPFYQHAASFCIHPAAACSISLLRPSAAYSENIQIRAAWHALTRKWTCVYRW